MSSFCHLISHSKSHFLHFTIHVEHGRATKTPQKRGRKTAVRTHNRPKKPKPMQTNYKIKSNEFFATILFFLLSAKCGNEKKKRVKIFFSTWSYLAREKMVFKGGHPEMVLDGFLATLPSFVFTCFEPVSKPVNINQLRPWLIRL